MDHARRFRQLRRLMKEQGVDSLLITHLPDVRYLCGFTGSNAYLAVAAHKAAMFTDGRYTVQAREQTVGAKPVIAAKSGREEACLWLLQNGATRCGFDPEATTVAELAHYRKALVRTPRQFFHPLTESIVGKLRMVKDEDELLLLQEAASLGVDLFHELLPQLQAGMPETTVAALLELSARLHGAEGMSFETIVAGGPRSALPHGHATRQGLPRKGFLTLDFGVILKGYCSDMTRTMYLGKPTQRERFTYDAVREAQQAAVEAVRPGVSCGDVDKAARDVLRKAGLAEFFTHSTGHGVGLEIHEAPRVGAEQSQLLVPGMVITIEPGIYLEGQFGIRIEDMVAVTRQGGQVLTPASTGWMQL